MGGRNGGDPAAGRPLVDPLPERQDRAAVLGGQPLGAPADGFELAFRAGPVALAIARDPHCRVVLRNAAMNRIVPASLDWQAWRLPDGSSPPLFDAAGVALRLEDQPLRRAAFRGEATVDLALELRWPGSEPVFLSVSAEPLFGPGGEPAGAVASAIDVSAARRAEDLRARRDDAERRDAAASSRARDELISLLGHEMRNPMNAIATAVEVLNRADPAAPEAQSARRIIGRQTRRLAHLMGDLGEVGRAVADRIECVQQPLELGALVQRCLDRAAAKAGAKALRFRTDLAEVRIDADADPLAQAIDRLFDDAISWAPDGGRLAVRLRPAASASGAPEAVLEIRDIGDAELPPAFEPGRAEALLPMSTGPALDRHGSGLGLSMALVRRIVEKHGGCIDARRHDPATGGSVFVVRLPALGAAPTGSTRGDGGNARTRPGGADDDPAAVPGPRAPGTPDAPAWR